MLIVVLAAFSAFFGVLSPFCQKEFIDIVIGNPYDLGAYFSSFPDEMNGGPFLSASHAFSFLMKSPVFLLLAAFFFLVLNLAVSQLVSFLGTKEAIYLQRAWSQRIYDHLLELRGDTLGGKSVGELVSVYTTDLPGVMLFLEQILPQACSIMFPLVLAPFLIVFLFHTPVASTMLIMGIIVLMNLILASRQSRFFHRFKKLAADRVGLVNEWIQNIRTLRILGWTRHFEKKIFFVREIETKNRLAMLRNGQTMNAVAASITFVLNLSVLMTMISNNHESRITPGALLALLWIVAIFLTRPFRQMPWFFTFLFDGITSLQRVADLLEINNKQILQRSVEFQKIKDLAFPDPVLVVKNLCLNIRGQEILKNISFTVGPSEFIAIVGEVGAGKSMLLLSLLDETGASFDEYLIGKNDGRRIPSTQLHQFFTFIPQEGFIMSASLRENVKFEYDDSVDLTDISSTKVMVKKVDEKIQRSLTRAQFISEQERITGGLDTEIGERGVNLSGGQKQRVSLARTDYHSAPIILLDDCLSAVDVDTERRMVDSLLLTVWKDRTRILVTHRLTVLEKVDRVLYLEGGSLIAQGRYQDLLQQHEGFRRFTSSVHEVEEGPL